MVYEFCFVSSLHAQLIVEEGWGKRAQLAREEIGKTDISDTHNKEMLV